MFIQPASLLQSFYSVAIALVVTLSISSLIAVRPSSARALPLAQASSTAPLQEAQKQMDESAPSSDEVDVDDSEPDDSDPMDAEVEAISDEELSQFADVLLVLESLQDSYRSRSIAAVRDIGLTLERFDQILVLVRSPEAEGVDAIPEPTNEESEQFQQAVVQISVIREDVQAQAQQAILDEGFAFERFQEISDAVSANPELENQVRQFMEMSRPDPS